MVEATGHVDYINTSIGVATARLFMIEASMHIPPGYAMFIPAAIRKAVDLPVVGVGRFKDPLQAERALAEGHCDLVGVVRGQIADAEFAAKARAGATDDIRLCLSCNQECVGRMGLNRWLGCIENPRTGREARAASVPVPPAPRRPRRVLVVGAGPAGLQAAIAAAAHGHRVDGLRARRRRPAGRCGWRPACPNRAELGDMVRNQLTECRRLGVEIDYGVERVGRAGRASDAGRRHRRHRRRGPAAVVGRPATRPTSSTSATCSTARPSPTGRVVVIDEIGFHHATSVAELLADRGCAVEVVTPGMVVGQDLGITLDMENWWIRADAKGIVQSTDLVPMGLDGTHARRCCTTRPGDEPAAHAGLGGARRAGHPVEWLYLDLQRAGVAVERVGDCVAPRRAHAAVVDGERAGTAVG